MPWKPIAIAVTTAVLLAGVAQAQAIPPYVAAAVASPDRAAKERDVGQKPAEVLAFAGVKPGDKVADFWPVPPYSTSLLSLVVGPKGCVYAVLPPKLFRDVPEADGHVREMLKPYANVTRTDQAFDRFVSPEPLDLIWLGKTYHDFPNVHEMGPLDIAALNRALFRALKPGGTLIVIDHAAPAGSGFLDTEADHNKRLHRIDPEVVKRQVTAAGFELVAESRLLANPDDDHTKSPFDPAMRNRTDRFVLKFRKPVR
jgi:predicted methyltransferase